MNPYCLEDIQSEIEILQIKRKKNILLLDYLEVAKPHQWKIKRDKLNSELVSIDEALANAYTKLDKIFYSKS